MQLNILIVEDMFEIRSIMAAFIAQCDFVNKVVTAKNADEMFEKLSENNNEINALILDLDLGKGSVDGLTAYSLCMELGYKLPAIIVTGEELQASHSHRLGIVDVVNKAIDFNRLRDSLNKMKLHYDSEKFRENNGIVIPIHNDQYSMSIFPSDILYFESVNREVECITVNHDEPLRTNMRLNFYEMILKREKFNFDYCHRSFLINFEKMIRCDGNELIMENGRRIPISDDKLKFITQRIEHHASYIPKENKGNFLRRVLQFAKLDKI